MSERPLPDLNRVHVFLRVVEEGGFTAAARSLALPKSSVSRAVALLEQELQTRLLRRSSRKVALTEAGQTFYERAARGVALVAEAHEALVDLESKLRGTIRVTTAVDIGVWLLAPLIARFSERYPAVTVEVTLTARVVDLAAENFDFALRAGAVRDEALIARKLPATDFALFAARCYLDQHPAPERVAELAAHRCVLFRAPTGRDTWALQGLAQEERVEVRGAIVADDFSFLRRAVQVGAGVGLLPVFMGDDTLVRVLPAYSAGGGAVNLVYPAARYMPRRLAVFRDFLLEARVGERA